MYLNYTEQECIELLAPEYESIAGISAEFDRKLRDEFTLDRVREQCIGLAFGEIVTQICEWIIDDIDADFNNGLYEFCESESLRDHGLNPEDRYRIFTDYYDVYTPMLENISDDKRGTVEKHLIDIGLTNGVE